MGIFDGIKANLRQRSAQKNLERMAYKEEYNKNRIAMQKQKARIDARESMGLNKSKTGYKKKKPSYSAQSFGGSSFGTPMFSEYKPKQKKKDPYPNINTDSGFTYGGFK